MTADRFYLLDNASVGRTPYCMPPTSLYSNRYSILQEPDLDNTSGGKRQSGPKHTSDSGRNPPHQGCGLLHAQKESRAWIHQNCLYKMSRKRLVRDAKAWKHLQQLT